MLCQVNSRLKSHNAGLGTLHDTGHELRQEGASGADAPEPMFAAAKEILTSKAFVKDIGGNHVYRNR